MVCNRMHPMTEPEKKIMAGSLTGYKGIKEECPQCSNPNAGMEGGIVELNDAAKGIVIAITLTCRHCGNIRFFDKKFTLEDNKPTERSEAGQ